MQVLLGHHHEEMHDRLGNQVHIVFLRSVQNNSIIEAIKVCMCLCIQYMYTIHVCVCTDVFKYMNMYVCMYICMYVCIYVLRLEQMDTL